MKTIFSTITLALLGACVLPTLAFAQADPLKTNDDSAKQESPLRQNWELKTLGGMQFWTDVKHLSGWRIQQNSETGHFRLLTRLQSDSLLEAANNVRQHSWKLPRKRKFAR